MLYIDSWGLIGFLKVGSISYQTPFLSNFQAFCPVLRMGSRASCTYQMNLGQQTLHEIEGEVERFKQQALPEIEKTLLEQAQTKFTEEKKKRLQS
jgi:hypothetical protein